MKKVTVAVLILMLVCAFAVSALAVSGDLTVKDAMAYSDAAMKNYVGTIPAGTSVLVRSHESYADVYTGGKVVYISNSALLDRDITSDYVATLAKGTRVYQQASGDAKSRALKSTGTVNVCMVNGDWALVQSTGKLGLYAYVHLTSLSNIRTK